MKKNLSYKNIVLGISLVFLFSNSIAQAEQISMTITSALRDRPVGTTSNHYLCLGDLSQNAAADTKVKTLNVIFPLLFINLSESEKNCFATDQVPIAAQEQVHKVLALMNQKLEQTLSADSADNKPNEHKAVQIILPVTQQKTVFKLRNQDKTVGRKFLRSQLLVGGTQALGMGVLIATPQLSLWEPGYEQRMQSNLRRAWSTAPVWDKDGWAVNYIGHPYSGALYYNAMRSQGATMLQSFIYASFQSTFWEYTIEAVAEQPSATDLIVTPIAGAILGELAHRATLGMRKNGLNTLEKITITIINPTYVLNNGYK